MKDNKVKLEYWDDLTVFADWAILSKGEVYGLICRVYRDGNIKIFTSTAAGHGEPSWEDEGRLVDEWILLLEEVRSVQSEYFPSFTKQSDHGDLIEIEKFKSNMFIDYDGHGYYATKDKESDVFVKPSHIYSGEHIPTWSTHVMWFNK